MSQVRYVYGSAARELAQPAPREPEYRPSHQNRPNPRKRPLKRQINKAYVIIMFVVFAVMFVFAFRCLQLKSKTTYLSKNVTAMENEVVELSKQNSNERHKLEETVNLDEIYKKATKELGMKNPTSKQIYSYDCKKSTQLRLYNK